MLFIKFISLWVKTHFNPLFPDHFLFLIFPAHLPYPPLRGCLEEVNKMECLSQRQPRDEVLTQQPVTLSQIKGDYQTRNRENSHFLSVLWGKVGGCVDD